MKFTKEIKEDFSDVNFFHALKRGEDFVFQKLYSAYKEEFLNWAFNNFNVSEENGLDIFQESIAGLYTNAYQGKLDESKVHVKTVLFAIGKNHLINYKKHDSKEALVGELGQEILENEAFIENPVENDEEHKELIAYLQELGYPCRQILENYYLKGETLSTIAEDLGYKNKHVLKSLKSRCIEKIKSYLKY